MKIRESVLFAYVVCGAVTACGEPHPTASAEEDWGASVANGDGAQVPDSGSEGTGSGTRPTALVVRPVAPDLPPCTSPYAPVLASIPTAAQLPIFANPADGVSVGVGAANDLEPASWVESNDVSVPASPTKLKIFSRLATTACPDAREFVHEYSTVDAFPPGADASGTTAISKDDSRFIAWASKVLSLTYGDGVTAPWQTPERALGPATWDTTDIVSLGEGGAISLGFDVKISDKEGYDLAVFENGFADNYLELAFVEVSSDGVNFVRFDTASLTGASIGAYGTLNATQLEGLAGKYRVGFGTPFDLGWLKMTPEVRSGLVNLNQITTVRIVDIIGDGQSRDSFGHVIFDPYPTTGSAGFDLDAIGVLNSAP